MPRKAPDKVIEHRISLSGWEREQIDSYLDHHRWNGTLSGVGTIAQAVSWPLLAAAALIYVGFNLDDFIDNQSDRLTSYLERKGWVNYQADEIGREIEKITKEQQDLWDESQLVSDPNSAYFNRERTAQIHARMRVLERRDRVLREMLDRIAKGEVKGYSFHNPDDPHKHEVHLDELYQDVYQDIYGESVNVDIPWDVRVGPNQDFEPSE